MPTKSTDPAPSFLQVYTQLRRDRMKPSFLRQIKECVDWRGIRTLLNKKYTKTQNATGNPAYDALMMFKILLLETWYGLSDYEVEDRINDSISFCEFLDLDLGLPAPDHSTISRFRLELTRLGIMDKLLRELNKQFKKQGISRINQGAIVDASIVDSPHSPDGSIVIEVADDREDTRSEQAQAEEEAYQYELKSRKPGVDTEARWVRKGKHYRYGYKKHVLTDEQGLVESIITTPANCADTVVLPDLIERIFESIRRWFSGGRCRYRGLERTHTQNILEAMAYNLKRMPGLLALQGAK